MTSGGEQVPNKVSDVLKQYKVCSPMQEHHYVNAQKKDDGAG